jgi:N-acetylmuramoyl-L-alanine amidase
MPSRHLLALALTLTLSSPLLAQLSAPTAESNAVQLGRTSPLTGEPDWSKLRALDHLLTADEFLKAWETLYLGSKALPPPWTLRPTELEVATGLPVAPTQKIAFRANGEAPKADRYWRRPEELPPTSEERPVLADLHIALDAGHIGGDYAAMEERLLIFDPSRLQEAVREGDSTLLTAKVLKAKLEAAGAEVSLVREHTQPLTPKRPVDFRTDAIRILNDLGIAEPVDGYAGLPGDQRAYTIQWQSEKLFYRFAEIRARADLVNQKLKPDFVVCLHLNAEGWGDAAQPQYSALNHFHILINGCYAPEELQTADVRFEALRRIFHRISEVELPLAETVAKAVADRTQLPPYIYTTPNARQAGTSSYVYVRNLLASRLYDCPVIYLEPYVMNHRDTYQRLLRGHYIGRTLANGRLQSSVIEDYASGVAQGIIRYFQQQRIE